MRAYHFSRAPPGLSSALWSGKLGVIRPGAAERAPLHPSGRAGAFSPNSLVMVEPALLQAALWLSEDERAELALRLVESLDAAPDSDDAEAAWAEEVVHRVEALHAGRAATVSLDEAIAGARAHVRRVHG
jgi:putative addiction module component (TIGR02574 family)